MVGLKASMAIMVGCIGAGQTVGDPSIASSALGLSTKSSEYQSYLSDDGSPVKVGEEEWPSKEQEKALHKLQFQ